jgi:hypothetical protein
MLFPAIRPSGHEIPFLPHFERLWRKSDLVRRIAHDAEYAPSGLGRKPESGLPYSKEPTTNRGQWVSFNCGRGAWSFRVALRPQPVYASGPLQPFIGLGFAFEPLDVPNIGTGIVGLNLPVVLCNALVFEGDTRFAHKNQYGDIRRRPLGRSDRALSEGSERTNYQGDLERTGQPVGPCKSRLGGLATAQNRAYRRGAVAFLL